MEHNQLYKIRHSLAHLLAMAALDKYPNAHITIGPVIDDGFYYDIDFGDDKISEDDLKDFQKKMKKLASQGLGFAAETVAGFEEEFFSAAPGFVAQLFYGMCLRDGSQGLALFFRQGAASL